MRIISWNVNGIRAVYKKGLIDILKTQAPDIFCVQETKAHIDQVEEACRELTFKKSYWSSAVKKGYSGTATFVNEVPSEIKTGWGQDEYSLEGRIVWTTHSCKGKNFDLYNIYFPNGGSGEARHTFKQKFLKDLNLHLKKEIKAGKQIVLVGDYNVAHTEIDIYDPVRLSKESGFLPEEREWFQTFLDLGFVDTFRHFYPDAKNKYTWWSYRELARISNRGWRIDYVCVTKGLMPYLKKAEILDAVEGSDHCPVMIELEF